jgi:hypothetical protein
VQHLPFLPCTYPSSKPGGQQYPDVKPNRTETTITYLINSFGAPQAIEKTPIPRRPNHLLRWLHTCASPLSHGANTFQLDYGNFCAGADGVAEAFNIDAIEMVIYRHLTINLTTRARDLGRSPAADYTPGFTHLDSTFLS